MSMSSASTAGKPNKKTGNCCFCRQPVKPGDGQTWKWQREGWPEPRRYYRHNDCFSRDNNRVQRPTEAETKGDGSMPACNCGHGYARHKAGGNTCEIAGCDCNKFRVPGSSTTDKSGGVTLQRIPDVFIEFWNSQAYLAWLDLAPAACRPYIAQRLKVETNFQNTEVLAEKAAQSSPEAVKCTRCGSARTSKLQDRETYFCIACKHYFEPSGKITAKMKEVQAVEAAAAKKVTSEKETPAPEKKKKKEPEGNDILSLISGVRQRQKA